MTQSVSPIVLEPRTHAGGAMAMTPTGSPSGLSAAPRRLPVAWIAAGVLALSAVAAGAYFAGRGAERAAEVSEPPAATTEGAPAKGGSAGKAPVANKAGLSATRPAQAAPAGEAATPAPAVACAQCGVIESVTAVQRKGEGTGVGAVAGTVVGGVLGNQVGGGNGRTAMTVLGALGGAVAGNEVEKHARAVTVYRVKVRTDGGEVRTVEQSTAPAVGQRVKVDGNRLQMLGS